MLIKAIRVLSSLGFTVAYICYFVAAFRAFDRDDFARATFYMAVSISFELSASRLAKDDDK